MRGLAAARGRGGMRQVGVKSSGRRRVGSLATAMKSSPLDWLLVVACGLLLLGHGSHSAAATASVRALCNQPSSTAMPAGLRTFCSWLFSNDDNVLFQRESAQPVYKFVRRLGEDDVNDDQSLARNGRSDPHLRTLDLQSEVEPPPIFPRPERYLQEPTAWETIKRQDNNHMFLRFGRRRK